MQQPTTGEPPCSPEAAGPRRIVAVVLQWRGRIALLRRSSQVGHDCGLWHCITGYVDPGVAPSQQALAELSEETGLRAADLLSLRPGPEIHIPDRRGNDWLVYTFIATTKRRRLAINWEHDAYRWATPARVKRFSNRVSWLDDVLAVAGPRNQATEALSRDVETMDGHRSFPNLDSAG